jgi:hypothetical protein
VDRGQLHDMAVLVLFFTLSHSFFLFFAPYFPLSTSFAFVFLSFRKFPSHRFIFPSVLFLSYFYLPLYFSNQFGPRFALQSSPVNCCWPSTAQSFLISGAVGTHNLIYIRSFTELRVSKWGLFFDERRGLVFLSCRHFSCTVFSKECIRTQATSS